MYFIELTVLSIYSLIISSLIVYFAIKSYKDAKNKLN